MNLGNYGNGGEFNSYSAGINFGHQNLKSKVDPRAVRVKICITSEILSDNMYNGRRPWSHNHGDI